MSPVNPGRLWSSPGWRRLRGNRLALFGLMLVSVVVMLALIAPWLSLADPDTTALSRRMLPLGSPGHLLGTDQLGRDLLSRLLWGSRTSLAVGFFAVLIAALLGTLIGLVAGYWRGWLDGLLMRSIDVLLAFPYLLLALAIVAALGPGLRNAMLAIAVVNIPFFARTVRGSVLELAQREFIEAARLAGSGRLRILFSELLPNVLPVVVIMLSTNLGWMILETAGLSFLGLGAQPPTADLGSMLGSGREFLTTAPHVAILPGLVILLLVVGINLLGDGVRDLLDPRLKGESGAGSTPGVTEPGEVPEQVGKSLLQVIDLSTQFHQNGRIYRAVERLSFELAAGERLGLVGESGSGKTVSALSLLGLVPAPGRIVGGRLLFRGEDLLEASDARWRQLRGDRIAYIPQDPTGALDPLFTIGDQMIETLQAHRRLHHKQARQQAIELLDRVRIPDPAQQIHAYPHELSGGMRQRVVIAMALAHGPDLIIADEATTALDVTVQAEILKLLDRLCREQGAALLFISHDLALVRQLCQRVLVMYAGRVVEQADTETLLQRPAHPYSRALLACVPELGRPDKPLEPIPGQPPPLDALPDGCHFAPRCTYAETRCRHDEIPLSIFKKAHEVRCVRARELAR
ncbi:MAG: dipeptide/oligopeptide/nickel ABC transporter permease/ATP-binding protein [Chromatiales bacterium]|jgi:peptide/nickel transport system permease protein